MNIGEFKINKLYRGDCVELLKKIPDNSIDLIFADPPYNLQLNGELYRPNQSKVEAVNDLWDKFDSMESYDIFSNNWLTQCMRVLKPTGSLWVIGTYHNIFRIGKIMQDIGFWIINDIVWIKSNPMPNFKGTRFNNAHETLIWAVKSKVSKYTFHYHSMKVMNDDLQMRSDWLIPICQGNEREKINGQKAHSTQKPAELLYRIIISTSNPDDIVLDPFIGSGTTAAVAKRLNRNFIGFEKEQKYIDVSEARISRITPLKRNFVEYKVEKLKPKVPFGNLIEKGFIKIGEELFSPQKKYSAIVQADSSVVYNNISGSIHKISALILNKISNNGWTFWHVNRDGNLVLIDELRNLFIKKYYASTYEEFNLNQNILIKEPVVDFLVE